MSQKRTDPLQSVISPEAQEEARNLIEQGLKLFREQLTRLSQDMADFTERRQEMRERRQRGARRTSGRIV